MKVLVFLCLLPAVFGGYLESLATSAAIGSSGERFQGMVAFHCGRPSLHLTQTGGWVRDMTQDCVKSADEVRTYCQRVYPELEIANVEPAPNDVLIKNWCDFHTDTCDSKEPKNRILVRPYRCLDAGFQSDALLVPSNCSFGHIVPGLSSEAVANGRTERVCKSYKDWNATATAECRRRFKGYKLQRYGALVACKKDPKHKYGLYEGVEFVCCPENQATPPPAEGFVISRADPNAVPQGGARRDLYVDYLNRAEDAQESEHKRYVDAKEEKKRRMTQKEDSLVKSFIDAEHGLDGRWGIDPAGTKQEEDTIIHRFRDAFIALLNEEMEELRQLDHIHQQRVFDKLRRKTIRCKKMLEYASQETDPKLDRITSAAFSYLRAVMKEKVHAINHHTHLLDTDPQEAKEQLPRLRKYLHQLHDDIKEVLDKMVTSVPTLKKELKLRILKFMRSYGEVESSAEMLEQTGRLSAKPIKGQSRKEAETEHMESVIKAYRHEPSAGGRKERPVVHVVPVPRTEGESDEEALADREADLVKKEIYETRVHHVRGHGIAHGAKALAHGGGVDHDHDDDHEHHEGDGHNHNRVRAMVVSSDVSTWTIIGCVAGVALVAAVTALLVLRRRYAGYTMSPGSDPATVAIERSLPPSAADGAAGDLSAMQTNGYENPTYKYFELRGQEEAEAESGVEKNVSKA